MQSANGEVRLLLLLCRKSPTRAYATSLLRFLDHTQLDTHIHTQTPCWTPLNEWSARRTGCYLHNIQHIKIHSPLKPINQGVLFVIAYKRLAKFFLTTRSTKLQANDI